MGFLGDFPFARLSRGKESTVFKRDIKRLIKKTRTSFENLVPNLTRARPGRTIVAIITYTHR